MLSILSDTQKAVVETITMRFHPTQALHYLKDAGHEMSRRTYFRHKKKIEEMKLERMQYIAEHFQEQHLERVSRCELIEKLMWDNYYLEKDATKKVSILESIVEMQPYISAYYDATRYVIEQGQVYKALSFVNHNLGACLSLVNQKSNDINQRKRS